MATIAVVNRKGGSGKSMLATHIAGYLASLGGEVMLGDVDRQQSSRMWLGLRPNNRPKISGWTMDERNFARPPAGAEHVVLDTPAGFQGVGLMRVALYADAILIPAMPSLFDRTAAAESIKELRTLPRVASGKCRIACVGLRIDGRTRNASVLESWARELDLPYLGTIRELQIYQNCVEQGLSVFDSARTRKLPCMQEWAPITAWLDDILASPPPQPEIYRPVPVTLTAKADSTVVIDTLLARRIANARLRDDGMDKPVPPEVRKEIPNFLRKLIDRVF